jgi:membrane protein DedA with SNARE-associated domain
MMAWFQEAVNWLVATVEQMGVVGIFIMTFLESTFMPIPCEIVMIPAGYLIHQGAFEWYIVWPVSIVGTIGGASFNYLIACYLGRKLFLRYGKYFLMTPEKLANLEAFFARHGVFSTFIGRLIPGIRHFISFPAGLARMDVRKFILTTALGGGLWMGILLLLGYHIGANKELLMQYMPLIKGGVALFIVLLTMGYVWRQRRRN